mmetsp:Transcript_33214/g.93123  ORF Transcript_33214/g.93123 Transcript_33214/m.93123 type:complete len:546 (-) Transcript_33214:1525-3162(-)|eukprot:CAMPEP_0119120960 /NCGR_PEP_ID=MMETSP1310-20130426/1791_1 /TAXON_ID=464262 /ORGANISM="Genus nov. species nov., Strain RCC2339" /LENGTH=545 /DNA_ID=CAMNT_0007110483 /DNA_START=30 /DNA_END=1667 /DNA_ORIENTATION=+
MKVFGVLLVLVVALASAQDAAVLSYYSNGECTDFVGSRGLANGVATFLRGAHGGSCGEELECLYNPTSDKCLSMDSTSVVNFTARTSNVDFNTVRITYADGRTVDQKYTQCIRSPVYYNCYYQYETVERFGRFLSGACGDEDPTDSSVTRWASGQSQVAFYSGADCDADNLAVITTLQPGRTYTVRGSNGASCVEQLTCFLYPDSDECDLIADGSNSFEAESSSVSTVQANFEGSFRTYTEDSCFQSALYPDCSYTFLTQDAVASSVSQCSKENLNFVAYYEENSDCSGADMVSIHPYSSQYKELKRGLGDTCQEQSRCAWDPVACQENTALSSVTLYTVNPEEDVTRTRFQGSLAINPTGVEQCLPSTFYLDCDFRVIPKENYRSLFACGSRGRLVDVADEKKDFSHITYYSADDCSADYFEASRLLGANDYTFVSADGPTCRESLNCLIQPDSPACQDLATGETETGTVEVVGGKTVYSDTVATVYSSSQCTQSSVFTGCYFRFYTNEEVVTLFEYQDTTCSGSIAVPAFLLAFLSALLAVNY